MIAYHGRLLFIDITDGVGVQFTRSCFTVKAIRLLDFILLTTSS